MLDDLIRCPNCGHTDKLENFGTIGANEGNCFCNECVAEISIHDNMLVPRSELQKLPVSQTASSGGPGQTTSGGDIGDPARVERFEDMSPRGRLSLMVQEDGDIIVGIIPSSLEEFHTRGLVQTTEFCTLGMGGGQSPNTRKALFDLIKAIEKDNREHPQHRE
jgi:hypothetical protein